MANNYMNQLNENTKKYYKILSKEFPEFLNNFTKNKKQTVIFYEITLVDNIR